MPGVDLPAGRGRGRVRDYIHHKYAITLITSTRLHPSQVRCDPNSRYRITKLEIAAVELLALAIA